MESDLIHEMIHEYVCKIDVNPSQRGNDLKQQYPNLFLGKGHDERFYESVFIVSEKLREFHSLEFEVFLDEIRSGYK